jgi:hypothetical protein
MREVFAQSKGKNNPEWGMTTYKETVSLPTTESGVFLLLAFFGFCFFVFFFDCLIWQTI